MTEISSNQPTILVKKTDGSTVRVPLSDIQKFQRDDCALVPSLVGEEREGLRRDRNREEEPQSPSNLPVPVGAEALATTTPVKKIFVDEALAKKREARRWKPEDHLSPLQEKLTEHDSRSTSQPLPSGRGDVVDRIKAKLTFPIDSVHTERFHSLITSWLKEIRTDEQVREYAMKPKDKGGLGLNEKQASDLMSVMGEFEKYNKKQSTSILQSIPPRQIPSPPPPRLVGGQAPLMGKNVGPVRKQIIHDVVPPPPQQKISPEPLGPIEEVGAMTLIDFRRLSADSMQGAGILKEKFENLKSDSYLLYLDARAAWFASPLYMTYKQVLGGALRSGATLKEYVERQEQGAMGFEEMMAVLEVNKKIRW